MLQPMALEYPALQLIVLVDVIVYVLVLVETCAVAVVLRVALLVRRCHGCAEAAHDIECFVVFRGIQAFGYQLLRCHNGYSSLKFFM